MGPFVDDYNIGDVKPILNDHKTLLKPTDGNNSPFYATEIAELATNSQGIEWHDPMDAGSSIDVESLDGEWIVSIFRDFDVRIYKEDEFPPVYNQALIHRKLLEWHFAVGLEEGEYIRKEATA
ncbi:hypothetical protein [Nibribacter koreensis]|uniref:hypothetical protein n=1 Tax=Nibribacter koreensis TaxID=1084519 RepID=UPI0031EE2056